MISEKIPAGENFMSDGPRKITPQKILVVLFLLILCQDAYPQTPYSLLVDSRFSSSAGAFSLAAAHRALYGLEGRLLKTRWSAEDDFGKKLLGISYRLSKTIFLENVIDHLAFLAQHEVFGHGARYREFGYSHNSYRLHLVYPYSDSQGWAFPGNPEPGRISTRSENLAMITGGFEADAALSRVICRRWVDRGAIHCRETFLYLFSSTSLTSYILRTKYHWKGPAANDVLSYLRTINPEPGIPETPPGELTLDGLARRTIVCFLNPLWYFSLYACVHHYLWAGRETMSLPMIPVGRARFLPFFRFGLAPFGTEVYLENFARLAGKTGHFYVRLGHPGGPKSWGAGLSLGDFVVRSGFHLEVRLDLWNQPSLLLGGKTVRQAQRKLGSALFGRLFFQFIDAPIKMGIVAQAGYKTDGYLEAEQLAGGFIFRIGLGFLE